ncbi:MAG: enoyl-CoA hydratase/isomerase family protein [Azospirillaceae bacterium]
MSGAVTVTLASDGALEVTLDRPGDGNVLTPDMTEALAAAFAHPPAEARFIVLSGTGPDFCAGRQSPMPPADARPTAADIRRAVADPVLDFYATVRAVPLPVIAVVRGRAFGVGCALAGLADLVIAADSARFCVPEMDRDIPPLLVMTALQDRLSRAALARLVLGREPVGGREAVALGLAGMSVPDDALDDAVATQRARLSANSDTVLRTVKRFLNAGPEASFATRRELAAAAIAAATTERYAR